MRLSTVLLAATIPACGFSGGSSSDDAPMIDAMPPPDATTLCFASGAPFTEYCFSSAANLPTAPQTFGDGSPIEIDTASSPMCNADLVNSRDDFCFVTGTTITLAAGRTLRAYGTRPLVLLATGAVELHGTVDVSSTGTIADPDPKKQGAGASKAACGGNIVATGTSGGFGASFSGKGGEGEETGLGVRGVPAAALLVFPEKLTAGCPGGDGGMGAQPGGRGGLGGGAVAVRGSTVHIDGMINASGAGGGGGPGNPSGGGGGGSGGMIILFSDTNALTVDGSGKVFANGGGGGEGGANNSVNAGQPGGVSPAPDAAAGGGGVIAGKDGGNGGAGSSGGTLSGANAAGQRVGTAGGGAGGGGAGFVHATGINGDAVIAPPSTDFSSPI